MYSPFVYGHNYLTGVLFGSSQAVTVAAHTVKVFWASLSDLELRAQRVELGDNLPLRAKKELSEHQ